MEQELPVLERYDRVVGMPEFMKEILAQFTFEARACSEINQASGVSVRVSINNYESLVSNAEKRSVRLGEREIVPRISDLHALGASTAGKIELEYSGEEKKGEELIERLLNRAVLKVFDRLLKLDDLKDVVDYFEKGWGVEVSDMMRAEEYLDGVRAIAGLREGIRVLGGVESPGFIAAATEFILEGLHLHQKLNKDREGGRFTFRA
jgi:magnesium chelatase subunit I